MSVKEAHRQRRSRRAIAATPHALALAVLVLFRHGGGHARAENRFHLIRTQQLRASERRDILCKSRRQQSYRRKKDCDTSRYDGKKRGGN